LFSKRHGSRVVHFEMPAEDRNRRMAAFYQKDFDTG
jgi:predicted enzyme related to lactoylglutathione lyase